MAHRWNGRPPSGGPNAARPSRHWTAARAGRSFRGMARPRTDSLSSGDWARAALEVLARSGIEAVAVEPLARRLKVTKGSFYWHFRSRAELLEAALREWETSATREVIALMETLANPRERLHRLFLEAMPGPPRRRAIELAVSDAASHPIVAPALRRRVDALHARLGAQACASRDAVDHQAERRLRRARLGVAGEGFRVLDRHQRPELAQGPEAPRDAEDHLLTRALGQNPEAARG